MPQAASISGIANTIETEIFGADRPRSAFAQLIGGQDLLVDEAAHSGLTDLEVSGGF